MKKTDLIKMLINAGIDSNEAKAEVELILEFLLSKTKEELLFINEFNDEKILNVIQERIKTKKPVQYLIGFAPFMGEKFIVNENVLIPRTDTEILVDETVKTALDIKDETIKILDIGTGSGIIACMCAKKLIEKNRKVEIIGVDISLNALNVAIDNMKKLNLTRSVMFRKSDLFSNVKEKFHIIVSNPPYIPKKEYETIQKEVKFEPYEALFVEDEKGIYYYDLIIKEAKSRLFDGGYLLFEIMKGQFDYIKELLEKADFKDIKGFFDIQGIKRIIKASV